MTQGALVTLPVIRMTMVRNAITWIITYYRHSDDRNIFIIWATGLGFNVVTYCAGQSASHKQHVDYIQLNW